jgi:hypothetical protein
MIMSLVHGVDQRQLDESFLIDRSFPVNQS